MAFYQRAFDNPDGGTDAAAPSPAKTALGAGIGLIPLVLVGIFFWAVLAPPPKVNTKFISRKG